MGYIFDALNNKNKDGQTADTAAQSDTPTDEQAVTTPPVEEDTPLSLSDVQLTIDTDASGEAVVSTGTASDEQPPAAETLKLAQEPELTLTEQDPELEPEADDTIDQALEPMQVAPASAAAPQRRGWWARLMGRHLRGRVDDRLVAMTSPASAMSEEYRSIRTSILARHDNERHLVHTITSATPQEGKTITCVNLGLSFAELRNRKTVIIECDLRLPTFAKLLSCDSSKPGLIDYLRGEARLADVIQQIEGSPLHIIPAGGRVSDEAVQLLSSTRMTRLIEALRTKYDHVLIDTPPVLQLADAGILGSQSEEVLLVARMRRTPRPLVEQAVNTLTSYNALVSGIIATDNPRSRGRGYGYKYGYGYRYGYGYTYGYTGESRKRRRAA